MNECRIPYILTDAGRYADLMKQGCMKPLPKPRIRKDGKPYGTPKAPPPIVACHGCENWHPKGRHIELDAGKRRANEQKYRAREKRANAIARGEIEI